MCPYVDGKQSCRGSNECGFYSVCTRTGPINADRDACSGTCGQPYLGGCPRPNGSGGTICGSDNECAADERCQYATRTGDGCSGMSRTVHTGMAGSADNQGTAPSAMSRVNRPPTAASPCQAQTRPCLPPPLPPHLLRPPPLPSHLRANTAVALALTRSAALQRSAAPATTVCQRSRMGLPPPDAPDCAGMPGYLSICVSSCLSSCDLHLFTYHQHPAHPTLTAAPPAATRATAAHTACATNPAPSTLTEALATVSAAPLTLDLAPATTRTARATAIAIVSAAKPSGAVPVRAA